MRASPIRFEKFQEYVDKEKIKTKCLLSLDVPTRWNSIYLILDCALKFVRVFDRLEEEDEHYKLYFCETDGNGKKPIGHSRYLDLENVKTFVKFLGIFYKATLRFFGSLFVTSNQGSQYRIGDCIDWLVVRYVSGTDQYRCTISDLPLFYNNNNNNNNNNNT